MLSRSALLQLLERRGDRSLIVIDEAYIEFSGEPSAVALLQEHGNLVVLRTLSKALAFAGARCGVAAGPVEVIRMLNAIQAPYAMATPVVECVEDALQTAALAQAAKSITAIIAERERVIRIVSEFDFVEKVWPSSANFFLLRVSDLDAVVRCVSEHGVLLRSFGHALDNCIRVTVGGRDENDRLLQALASLEETVS